MQIGWFFLSLALAGGSWAAGLGEGVLLGLLFAWAALAGGFAAPRRRRLAPAPALTGLGSAYESRIYEAVRLYADRLEVLPLVVTAPRGSHRLVWAARAAARLVALKGLEYSYYRLR